MQHNKKMCILNENENRLATIVMPFKAPQKASRGGDGAGKEGGENSQKYATKLQNVQGCKQPGEWWRGIRGGRQG